MTVLKMEIVVRPVQVGRHYCYVVCAVLDIETLAHLQSGNLGDGVRFVGVFQRRCEQAVFFHRLRSFARIDACTAEEKQFLHSMTETFSDDILLYLQVLPYEIGAVLQVGHYATYMCRREHDGIGLLTVEELFDSGPVQKIQFAVAATRKIGIPSLQQIVPDGRTYQSVMSGHIYFRVFVQHINSFSVIPRTT